MTLSVVIPTLGHERSILGIAHQVCNQEDAGDLEVLLIFNPAASLSLSLRRQLESLDRRIRCFAIEKRGANAARNAGIDLARGKIILLLDDDCQLSDPHFLRKHLLLHETHPRHAVVGGTYRLPYVSDRIAKVYHQLQMDWLFSGLLAPAHFHERRTSDTSFLLGGNCSFKSKVFEFHRFDKSMTFGGTETELFLRLRAEGWRQRSGIRPMATL